MMISFIGPMDGVASEETLRPNFIWRKRDEREKRAGNPERATLTPQLPLESARDIRVRSPMPFYRFYWRSRRQRATIKLEGRFAKGLVDSLSKLRFLYFTKLILHQKMSFLPAFIFCISGIYYEFLWLKSAKIWHLMLLFVWKDDYKNTQKCVLTYEKSPILSDHHALEIFL